MLAAIIKGIVAGIATGIAYNYLAQNPVNPAPTGIILAGVVTLLVFAMVSLPGR